MSRFAGADAPDSPAVYLADFGLAKNVETGSRYTRTGVTLGTPSYMSPEQARGDSASMTAASDTWALGCVLYELLSGGCRAFDGETPAAAIGRVLTHSPPALRHVPRSLNTVVALCLQKDIATRYQHADALREDARRVLGGARPIGQRPSRWLRSALLGATGVGLVIAIAFAVRPTEQHEHTPSRQQPEAQRLVQQGRAVWQSDPALALQKLAAACALDPLQHAWRVRLGSLRWVHQGAGAAQAEWSRVPISVPESARARWLHGLSIAAEATATRDASKREDTAAAWRIAASGSPPEARWATAGLALLDGDHARARELLGEPAEWSAALLRGLIDSGREAPDSVGGRDEAIRAYELALNEGLPFAWAHVNLARLRQRAGNLAGALDACDRAIVCDARLLEAYVCRFEVRSALGDLLGASADLDRAIALQPGLAALHVNRGQLRRRLGDPAGAEADYEQALQLNPESATAYLDRGNLRQTRGDSAGARRDYDRALQIRPEYAKARYNRGRLRQGLNDLSGAAADYQAAVRIDPAYVHAMGALGHVQMRRGRWAEAIEALERFLDLDPDADRASEAKKWLAHCQSRLHG